MTTTATLYRCRICDQDKPRSAFWAGTFAGGVQWACKPCHVEYTRRLVNYHRFWRGINYDVVTVVTTEKELRVALMTGWPFLMADQEG